MESFGFNALYAILLQLPVGCHGVAVCRVYHLFREKDQPNIYAACLCLGVSCLKCLLLTALPQTPIKLLGYYLAWAFSGAYAMILTTIATNTKGYSKKVFTNGTLMVFYTVGAVIGPLIMVAKDALQYKPAMAVFTVAMFICIVSLLLARWSQLQAQRQSRHYRRVH